MNRRTTALFTSMLTALPLTCSALIVGIVRLGSPDVEGARPIVDREGFPYCRDRLWLWTNLGPVDNQKHVSAPDVMVGAGSRQDKGFGNQRKERP